MMKNTFATIVLWCVLTAVNGQILSDSVFLLPDSVKPFTLENFYHHVLQYHPVAKQAQLLTESGRQEIRMARGHFDPKLEAQYLLKQYNGKEYYRMADAALKVPTRSPITPAIGMERNTGDNLNPENYISSDYDYKQFYVGITLPLGSGLMTDERRVAIKQAELFGKMMQAEQIKVINKLLLEGATDYWEWYFSYYSYRLASNTAAIAEEILRRTKLSFDGGELARMDTVQARITYLERRVAEQEAFADLQNNRIHMSSYLWDSLMNPVDLPLYYAPLNVNAFMLPSEATLTELLNHAKANHPDLQKINLKMAQLKLDRRLAVEFMKPRLDVTYYMLNQPVDPYGFANSFALDDNFKLGVDFSLPLFLRKEKAKLAQTELKLNSTMFELDITSRQIINEITATYNQLVNNGIVLQQQRTMTDHYYSLMNAELLNLENGESDLFKTSVQQEKLFNAQFKLIKVMAEYHKDLAYLYWTAGTNQLELR